jgi:NADP-dependent 3-hydroxy acid dehydrogenase YdfG
VLVGARNFERGEAAAREIGAGAIALQLDVTDRVSIAEAAQRIREKFGRSPRCHVTCFREFGGRRYTQ